MVVSLPHSSLKFNLVNSARFRETRVSPPQMLSYCLSRFHPTDAVFACGLSHGQVTIFKGANRSMPFSNWEIERELKVQNVQKVESLEWNVSYSNFSTRLEFLWLFVSPINVK